MTTAIEVTKREMCHAIAGMKGRIEINYSVKDMLSGVDNVEHALEAHLEALRQDRAALVAERDTLRNRVQVLELANSTSGEVIRGLKDEATQARRARMKARIDEFVASASTPAENVASEAPDVKPGHFYGASTAESKKLIDEVGKLHQRLMRKIAERCCMHSFHEVTAYCVFCGVRK